MLHSKTVLRSLLNGALPLRQLTPLEMLDISLQRNNSLGRIILTDLTLRWVSKVITSGNNNYRVASNWHFCGRNKTSKEL